MKKDLYNQFLGFLIKNGNKNGAKRVLDQAFFKLSKKVNLSTDRILLKIFIKLNSFVEVKKIRSRRSTHIVPFPITFKRRYYLAFKWLMLSINEDKRKISSSEKIYTEVLNLLTKKSSNSINKKEINLSLSLKNRSNIHYR